jgi:hypothetical protein
MRAKTSLKFSEPRCKAFVRESLWHAVVRESLWHAVVRESLWHAVVRESLLHAGRVFGCQKTLTGDGLRVSHQDGS